MFEFSIEQICIATESMLLGSSLFPNNEQQIADAYSEHFQISKMKCFTKIVNSF